MRGWKAKLVFVLIVYLAGFATAVYYLAPLPDAQASEENPVYSAVKTQQFVEAFNVGMHKCVDFAKDATLRASSLIKQKLKERRMDS